MGAGATIVTLDSSCACAFGKAQRAKAIGGDHVVNRKPASAFASQPRLHAARKLVLGGLGIGLALQALPASAMYLCEFDDGRRIYQSVPGSNCELIRLRSITRDNALSLPDIPPAPRAARSSAPAPAAALRSTDAAATAKSLISPASFPRIDLQTQRHRDETRRRILEDELRSEQGKLTRLRGELDRIGEADTNRADLLRTDMQRAEANVKSLLREISLVR